MKKDSVIFDSVKAEEIVSHLLTEAVGLRYGAVSVSVKIHDGRIVDVTHSRTEHTRDLEIILTKKDN